MSSIVPFLNFDRDVKEWGAAEWALIVIIIGLSLIVAYFAFEEFFGVERSATEIRTVTGSYSPSPSSRKRRRGSSKANNNERIVVNVREIVNAGSGPGSGKTTTKYRTKYKTKYRTRYKKELEKTACDFGRDSKGRCLPRPKGNTDKVI